MGAMEPGDPRLIYLPSPESLNGYLSYPREYRDSTAYDISKYNNSAPTNESASSTVCHPSSAKSIGLDCVSDQALSGVPITLPPQQTDDLSAASIYPLYTTYTTSNLPTTHDNNGVPSNASNNTSSVMPLATWMTMNRDLMRYSNNQMQQAPCYVPSILPPPNQHLQQPTPRTSWTPDYQPHLPSFNIMDPHDRRRWHNQQYPPGYPTILPKTQTTASGHPFDPPKFEKHKTKQLCHILNSSQATIEIQIVPQFTKGMFNQEDIYCCYRRNYFEIALQFALLGTPSIDNRYYLQRYGSTNRETILGWAVSLDGCTAADNGADSEHRELVVHDPKRTRDKEKPPDRVEVLPYYPPQLSMGGSAYTDFSSYTHSVVQPLPTYYHFQRHQYKKATANNGKRRARQQYYELIAQVEVKVRLPNGAEEWVKIAEIRSEFIIVRGRSPGHYQQEHHYGDGRRDNSSDTDHYRTNAQSRYSTHYSSRIPTGYSSAYDSTYSNYNPYGRHNHYSNKFVRGFHECQTPLVPNYSGGLATPPDESDDSDSSSRRRCTTNLSDGTNFWGNEKGTQWKCHDLGLDNHLHQSHSAADVDHFESNGSAEHHNVNEHPIYDWQAQSIMHHTAILER